MLKDVQTLVHGFFFVDSTKQFVEKDIHCGCQLVCCQLLNSDFELSIIFVDSEVQY